MTVTIGIFRDIAPPIHAYQMDHGYFPIYTGEWHDPITSERWGSDGVLSEFLDGWGNPYWYTSVDGMHYTLMSYGKDKKPGCLKDDTLDCDIIWVDGWFTAPEEMRLHEDR